MDIERLRSSLNNIKTSVDDLLNTLPSPEPEITMIKAGESLQSYLDKGGEYVLEAGAVFESQGFVIQKPVIIHGNGGKLIGTIEPAFTIRPGTTRITLSNLELKSANKIAALLGFNTVEQNTIESIPSQIVLDKVRIPTHRGIRGFEINSNFTSLINCSVEDCWLEMQESKAVNILNTTGDIAVVGGKYSAGAINFFIGGDSVKVPGIVPSNITLEAVELVTPMKWRTDGINRNRKNIFECKTGKVIKVINCSLIGSWVQGQGGYAFMFTPSNGGIISDVEITNCRVRLVGGVLNARGLESSGMGAARTKNIVVRRVNAVTESKTLGGTGRFALLDGVENFSAYDSVSINDGSSLIYGTGTPIEKFVFENNYGYCNSYGMNFAGGANGSLMAIGAKSYSVINNHLANANLVMKRNFPDNRYYTPEEFKMLFDLDWNLL